MSLPVRPLKSKFRVPGSETTRRFSLKLQVDVCAAMVTQRRPTDSITCKLSYCDTSSPKSSPRAKATIKDSPKRKKGVKESDLVKPNPIPYPSFPMPLAVQTIPLQTAARRSTYVAVSHTTFIYLYDFQRSVGGIFNLEFFRPPLCHDINAVTATTEMVELAIGFDTGDVAVWAPLQRRLTNRFNREKCVDGTAVTCVRWLPFDANLVAVGHESGLMYVYDRRMGEESAFPKDAGTIFTVLNQSKAKCNPLQKWFISDRALNDVVFSPSLKYCAIPSRDSHCHLLHWADRRLWISFKSFFGAVLCAAWSPDERLLVAGGEDDVVSVYDLASQCLVARCAGHHSWVTALAFHSSRVEERNELSEGSSDTPCGEHYGVVSAGQDSHLLFWEVEPNPKDEQLVVSADPDPHDPLAQNVPNPSCTTAQTPGKPVPTLDPISAHRLHHEPICSLAVCKDGVFTLCAAGIIKFWQKDDA